MISNAYAKKILEVMFGSSKSIEAPTETYLGICSSEPNASTGAVTGEPSAPSYARTVVSEILEGGGEIKSKFGKATGGIITNKEEIQMKIARTAWGTMNYFFISESATGPAIIWGKLLNKEGVQGVTIGEETVPVFYDGDLKASIDVELSQ